MFGLSQVVTMNVGSYLCRVRVRVRVGVRVRVEYGFRVRVATWPLEICLCHPRCVALTADYRILILV